MLPLRALADRGFLAVAIDGRYHGERAKSPSDYPVAILRAYRAGHGHPFLYDTVWDAMRLVDYLATRPDVDPARIGMMGISKGGIETYLRRLPSIRGSRRRYFRHQRAELPVGARDDAWQPRIGTFQPAIDGAAADAGVKKWTRRS